MRQPVVRRLLLDGETPGTVQGVFYDMLFTARGVMLYAVRPGLQVFLLWIVAPVPGAGLGDASPVVSLDGGRIRAASLEWMRTKAGPEAPFREALFHMRLDQHGRNRWTMPAQQRAYGAVRPRERDVSDVLVELHTHPAGCRGFSTADDADDYGFNVQLVVEDIAGAAPRVYARAAVYDHHLPIPVKWIADLPAGWMDGWDDQASREMAEHAAGELLHAEQAIIAWQAARDREVRDES